MSLFLLTASSPSSALHALASGPLVLFSLRCASPCSLYHSSPHLVRVT